MSFPNNPTEAAAWEYAKRHSGEDASAIELYDNYMKALPDVQKHAAERYSGKFRK